MKYSKVLSKLFICIYAVTAVFSFAAVPAAVYAQAPPPPAETHSPTEETDPNKLQCNTENCNRILGQFTQFINILSALVGIVVIFSIVYGGIQYTMAGDNAQKLTDAKTRIRNALIALAAYFLLYAFLQWLIPGGIF